MRVNKLALVLVLSCLAYEVNAKETPAKITAGRSEAELVKALDAMQAAEATETVKKLKKDASGMSAKELEKRLDAELIRAVALGEVAELEEQLKEMKDVLTEQERCMGLEGLEWSGEKVAWTVKADSNTHEMDSCARNKRDLETCTVMKVKRAVKACQELADEKKEILSDK